MVTTNQLKSEEIAVRAHDITVCLERTSVSEFDTLAILGMSVRLALHLRGAQALPYTLVRDVAIHLLDFPATAVRPVLLFLAEAEFVKLDTVGNTIRTVIPDVPYYEQLFTDLGEVASSNNFSEPEWLTLILVQKLAASPLLIDHVYQLGADKQLADRIIRIGSEGAFIVNQRARGKTVLISPTYFPENNDAYADLVAASGAQRVKRVLDLLKSHQGWPLAKILRERELAGSTLDDADIAVLQMLAGEGFVSPPAIETKHAGRNHFLFGPRPGGMRISALKRPVYEAAMALIAAVRQGQLLPAHYAIRSPVAVLRSFRDKGYISATTEAIEQYRQVAALRVGRLEQTSTGWAKLVLIDLPENIEAVNLAISLISGDEPPITAREDIVLSIRQGERFVESLIGRKRIQEDKVIEPDPESAAAIESFLLRGRV